MKSAFIVSLVALALVAAPVSMAQAQDTAAVSTAGIKDGTYAVDPSHTQVVAKFMHMGFNPLYIFFGEPTGTLTLNQNGASSVDMTFAISSLRTSVDKLTTHLKSADFFDQAKYPTARFTSTNVKVTGPTEADITGNLTLHGVTKPVLIRAKLTGQGANQMTKAATVGFEGLATVKRSDFGMGAYVPMVGDDITLQITAAFEQAAQ